MADIVEYLYRGSTLMMDNVFDWILKEDGTAISATPSRLVLTLTPIAGGSVIVCDTNTLDYSLGTPGTNEHFRWTAASGTLVVDLGGKAIGTFPAGIYEVELQWYDGANANGIRWGRQNKIVVVE